MADSPQNQPPKKYPFDPELDALISAARKAGPHVMDDVQLYQLAVVDPNKKDYLMVVYDKDDKLIGFERISGERARLSTILTLVFTSEGWDKNKDLLREFAKQVRRHPTYIELQKKPIEKVLEMGDYEPEEIANLKNYFSKADKAKPEEVERTKDLILRRVTMLTAMKEGYHFTNAQLIRSEERARREKERKAIEEREKEKPKEQPKEKNPTSFKMNETILADMLKEEGRILMASFASTNDASTAALPAKPAETTRRVG